MLSVVEDVACTVCGCVCDDIRVTVEDGQIVKAERACTLAEPWFLGQPATKPAAATIGGRAVPLSEAIEAAADILRHAEHPLIYGLSRSSTPGQRAAVALADQLGATIDTTASRCHSPSIQAVQDVGEPTCTLGEIRNRADLVIYWGSNPAVSHPRHGERYAVEASGRWISGRKDRYVVVADIQPTDTSAQADLYLPITPGQDFAALWSLRCLLQGRPVDPETCGAPLEMLQDLVQRMRNCKCGIVFFGLGLTRSALGHLQVEALLRLVRDLNDYTRFYARRMRIQGDVAGADSVLCWQTGYPFSVNLSRGYPRYNPGEFSANDLLERGEVDACLLVGSEGVEWFTEKARAELRQIPVIALDYPAVPSFERTSIRFTTAIYGLHLTGTAYRMDEVPVPLKAVLPPAYQSDEEILHRLQQALLQA